MIVDKHATTIHVVMDLLVNLKKMRNVMIQLTDAALIAKSHQQEQLAGIQRVYVTLWKFVMEMKQLVHQIL